MLATAIVKVKDNFNNIQPCRAFLDGGASASFITESCIRRLGLVQTRAFADVSGLASCNVGKVKSSSTVTFHPHFSQTRNVSFTLNMLILPNLTAHLPSQKFNKGSWPHLHGLQLADPDFHIPAKVDILLGSDIFWDLLGQEKKRGRPGMPVGVNSKLGWLVAGPVNLESSNIAVHHTDLTLDARVQKFWELEAVPTVRVFTKEEQQCEQHFLDTTCRRDDGKYIVSFPFKRSPVLGASRDIALRRFYSLEKRLHSQPHYSQEYRAFMDEYLKLGHMEEAVEDSETTKPSSSYHSLQGSTKVKQNPYYIPHHLVLKESSTTTKFRVVFDASSKTAAGVSLNEELLVGPTIQDSLSSILMRFRTHTVVFTADIAKMYRQILIDPSQADFQRILWRDDPKQPIKEYRLLTVTYGTASAPFHATRVLHQLAEDEKCTFPLAAKVTKRDFYVDDLMSGAPTVSKALEIQSQLLQMSSRGGFTLRKWTSNYPEVLSSLPVEFRETQLPISLDKEDLVKTLGVYWNAGLDTYTFKVQLPPVNPAVLITKRILLSEMAKVFDPLGWLAPIIVKAKILLQQLWRLDIGWDDALPCSIHQEWMTFRNELPCIEEISMSRNMQVDNAIETTLHGFCDASELAYAAVVYCRAQQQCGKIVISLIASKTRVAPSKQISLPRLELCGALLLSKLMKNIDTAIKVKIANCYAWSDSTTVLDWLNGHPSKWKTFVANRVTEIQDGHPLIWGHVKGADNPADCASRGISPCELKNHPLWWKGPKWLMSVIPSTNWRILNVDHPENENERRKTVLAATVAVQDFPLLADCSSLRQLKHISAWCLRFIQNCKISANNRKNHNSITLNNGPLSSSELDEALLRWVRISQFDIFCEDINCLKRKSALSKRSCLRSLNPFLDSTNLLRVGGRLGKASLEQDQKQPFVLPRHHKLTDLIIRHEHEMTLHGGPQLVLATIQKRFWIVRGKDAVRQHIRKCIPCTRQRAAVIQQPMGELPKSRVTPTRAFLTCGVDYAGPFIVRAIPGRCKVNLKAYLALFICFSTRAVHLEVVSSMSTEVFLAALRRFVARRGRPKNLHSDCGTNFVGAAREMKEFLAFVHNNNKAIAEKLADDGISWHFNPPGAPHFGGLWEAGVKSVKYHLHRIIGTARLTFEELTTVMTQIEAVLNSRPLTSMSPDPNELFALTPGHFLVGDALLAIPEADLTSEKVNRLSRWQMVQQLTQHFWRRWSNEFLARLQQRPKWLKSRVDIRVGDLVLVKEDNLAPLNWKLGRIVAVHPGTDGVVRVATLRTAEGEVKRPVVKLCLLPIDNDKGEIAV